MTNPRYTLLMHKGNGMPLYCELDEDEFRFVDIHPEQYQIFVITGREFTVLVATEDRSMTYQNALKCASSFILGQYQKIEVDLKRLIGTVTTGTPKLKHPPH